MTTAVDTNVIIALSDRSPSPLGGPDRSGGGVSRGGLVLAAPVFAELLAAPGRTEAFVDAFLEAAQGCS